MRALYLVAALSLFSLQARAAGFPNMDRFSGMSVREMKKLPDVRVPLCRPISKSGLGAKTKLELSLMKNSIFAQVGYKFKNEAYSNYFHSRSWYSDRAYHPEKLCATDNENSRILGEYAARAVDKPSHGSEDNGYGGGYGYGEEGDGEEGYGYDNGGYGN